VWKLSVISNETRWSLSVKAGGKKGQFQSFNTGPLLGYH